MDGDNANDTAVLNPVGGTQGADLSTAWVDGTSDGIRTISATTADKWNVITVTRGGVTSVTDSRYFFIDFERLVAGGHLQAIPKSASSDNKPSGSTEAYDGTYSWYVDERGEIGALYKELPSTKGFVTGVFP